MPLLNYGHSVMSNVQDKLVYFPPGPAAGSPGGFPSYATVGELGNYFRLNALQEALFGLQLGGTFVTLLMIVFLTRRSQRDTWVFRWNTLALLMNMARLISFILYNFTGLADPYSIQSDDITMVQNAELTVPILQRWFGTLLLVCCYASLILQSQSLSNTMYGWKRLLFLGFNYFMTSIPICAYLVQTIVETRDIVQSQSVTPNWLPGFSTISFAVCTAYQAALFVIKLGFAVYARRKLGMKQFGPTQIAFIMFCQTMILPGVTSRKERDEMAIRLNKAKQRRRAQRQSSSSCNTLWFDSPGMAEAHLQSKKGKGTPLSGVAPEMSGPAPSSEMRIIPLSRAPCNSPSRIEQGYGPGYVEEENDNKLAPITTMSRSLTTLNLERRDCPPHHSSAADILGQRPDDGTATVQSMESDGLSSHEATMGRSMITAPTSPYYVPEIYTQGAEGLLFKTHFLTPSTPAALKIRPTKPYRHPTLDKRLTRARLLQEARCLVKLSRDLDISEGVSVPGVLALECDPEEDSCASFGEEVIKQAHADLRRASWMMMEWIPGPAVRTVVEQWERWMKEAERAGRHTSDDEEVRSSEDDMKRLLQRIGRAVGMLHKAGIVHGDLTTSNLILRQEGTDDLTTTPASTSQTQSTTAIILPSSSSSVVKPKLEGPIALIDFGLASQSIHEEDRAVDLYVLERAFGSSHPRAEKLFDSEVLGPEGYTGSYKGANIALKRLADVRLRGRKRSMIG
ncbi:serine/threonine-protein kinase bud32 [Ascosphaera aggregata]|nr:serine/threonine-protein kinase bud32 [Ascosphaera aggregata]